MQRKTKHSIALLMTLIFTLTIAFSAMAATTGYVTLQNGEFYEYDLNELTESYDYYSEDPNSPEAELFKHYMAGKVVAEVDSEKGYMDYDGLADAYDEGKLDEYKQGTPNLLPPETKVRKVEAGEGGTPSVGDPQEIGTPPAAEITITSVEALLDINVDYGTAVGEIALPTKVTLNLSDGTTADVDATFACATYDENVAAEYVFTATYELPEGVTGDKPAASVKVIVAAKEDVALAVESVSAITDTYVEVTFDALEEAMEDVTVEVKDSKGVVVPVQEQYLAVGVVGAQFDFVTAYKGDLEGVWTVNGVEYDFGVLAKFEAIMDAVTANNQVALLGALNNAGIENIDEALIEDYLTDIGGASPAPENLADVQEIINESNETAQSTVDQAAVVKAVENAKTQVALLNALKDNYKRVNSDWIVEYASGAVGSSSDSVAGILVNTAPTANTGIVADGATDSGVALTYANIQTIIDAVNARKIADADAIADTAAKQAAVTALIETWVEADDPATPAVTPKADYIEASEINRLGFVVAEATTQNALYNALVAYANATPDATLKVSELNTNLRPEYLAEMNAGSGTKRAAAVTGFTGDCTTATYDYKINIVSAADTAALGDNTSGALKTINDLTSASTAAQVKSALQRLADVTSHKTGPAKFDMSTVIESQLMNYVNLATDGFEAATITSIALVDTAISKVNNAVEDNEALATIAKATSTAEDVRAALLHLALGNTNISTDAYVNLSPQAQKEVAQFIIDNRASLADPVTVSSVTAHATSAPSPGDGDYDSNAIQQAIVDHAAKVGEFNAIGDLSSATALTTKTALDTYAYDAYVELGSTQRLAVANYINALTKDVGGTETTLDFSGADAVKTLKAANDIIDAAIAAI